jgi:hypothetical protein
MAGRPKRRARLARENPGRGKTFSQLVAELRRIGPGVVAAMVLAGSTKQCQSMALEVAAYLSGRGFIARTDIGAGKYRGHYDLGVYTSDHGWIAVDPTFIQFHAPISPSHALQLALAELPEDLKFNDHGYLKFRGSEEEEDAIIDAAFAPTLQWSVDALRDGVKAFELSTMQSGESLTSTPAGPPPWGETWEDHWDALLVVADKLKAGRLSRRVYPAAKGPWAKGIGWRFSRAHTKGEFSSDRP